MQRVRGPLRPGACVGLISPASGIDRGSLGGGLRVLERAGFAWRLGRATRLDSATGSFHADTPEARAAELMELALDPSIDALLAVRGGVGSLGILPFLDYPRLREARTCLIGMSDITALALALVARSDLPSFAAPMPSQLGRGVPLFTIRHWRESLGGTASDGPIDLPKGAILRSLTPGVAEGPLLPCNLSLLVSLLGTSYCPSLDGVLLLLEDVDETPLSIDRMLSRLRLTGACERLAGVVLGQFNTRCGPRDAGQFDHAAAARGVGAVARVPAIADFPHGHEPLTTTPSPSARASAALDRTSATRGAHVDLGGAAVAWSTGVRRDARSRWPHSAWRWCSESDSSRVG
ncbi:MAG: LD-carboxypeptidase [Candidatus Eisenbacteria bacterium]